LQVFFENSWNDIKESVELIGNTPDILEIKKLYYAVYVFFEFFYGKFTGNIDLNYKDVLYKGDFFNDYIDISDNINPTYIDTIINYCLTYTSKSENEKTVVALFCFTNIYNLINNQIGEYVNNKMDNDFESGDDSLEKMDDAEHDMVYDENNIAYDETDFGYYESSIYNGSSTIDNWTLTKIITTSKQTTLFNGYIKAQEERIFRIIDQILCTLLIHLQDPKRAKTFINNQFKITRGGKRRGGKLTRKKQRKQRKTIKRRKQKKQGKTIRRMKPKKRRKTMRKK